jgi:hypothetical protein
MMKEDKYMDTHDAFSEKIKQKLANHTMPVDADVWKGVQRKLAPRRRLIPWWAYVSVSAAAGIALFFSLGNFFLLQDQPNEHHDTTISENEIVSQEEVPEIVKQLEVVYADALDKKSVAKNTIVLDVREIQVVGVAKEQVVSAPESEEANVLEAIPEEKEAELSLSKSETQSTSETQSSKINTLKEKVEELEADWTEVIKKKEDRKMFLAAGVGSGIGSSSVSMPGRSRAFRHESLVNLNTNYNEVLTPNDFNNKDYMPPVTVGVTARLPLNERFSLESGLVYTYLTTKLSGNSTADYTAALNLHYLGVPLNLITSLFKESHWEIYVSTGGAIEKGLRSDFKQYQDYGTTLFATEANTSIDGFQWSVNASLGVAYHFNQHVSLYLDPKLSYYFENDQPFSIRSEMPLLMGLNTGLRMML